MPPATFFSWLVSSSSTRREASLTARRSRCNCFYFSTHTHRTAQHFARTGTDLLERVTPYHHFRECAFVRRKINSQFRAFQLPPAALIHDLPEKFLLHLNRGLDFHNLLLRDFLAARLRSHVGLWFRFGRSCNVCRRLCWRKGLYFRACRCCCRGCRGKTRCGKSLRLSKRCWW